MPNNILRLFGRILRHPYAIIVLLLCPTQLLAQESAIYPSVRLDLNAGNFLNTLPFDQPFQIQGRIPQDITQIQVTFEECFNTGYLFGEQPQSLAAFETEASALLDSVFSSPNADTAPRTLQRQLSNLLRQNANLTGGTSSGSALSFLPWHGAGRQSKSVKLITRSTLFDPSEAGISAREKFSTLIDAVKLPMGQQSDLALDRLNRFVLDEVRSVRLISAPTTSSTTQGTWQKLHPPLSVHSEPLQSDSDSRWNRLEQRLQGNTAIETGAFRIVMPSLKANSTYLVYVEAERKTPADSMRATNLHTSFWSDTHTSNYVSLDVGLLYVPEIKETSVYVGSNFYLRPVAKSVPLQTRGGFMRRFAFTVGLTVQDIEDDRATRRALLGPVSVVLGAGLRVSKYLRLSGGVLVFRERDPDTFPLTTRTALTGSPYVSASFDMDVGKHIKGLGGLFGITERGEAK